MNDTLRDGSGSAQVLFMSWCPVLGGISLRSLSLMV